MPTKSQVSGIVAAGDTVKTTLGSLDVPKSAKRIIGVWCHAMGGPGNTTLENVTGIFELESPDLSLQPLQFPLDCLTITGTGVGAINPRVFPVDIPVTGLETITCFVTLDMAQTLANTCRWGLIYDA